MAFWIYYSTSDSIAFRANAPAGTTQNLTVKAYAKTYVTIIVDNGTKVSHKIETGGTAVFSNTAVHSNATIYVTPESLIESITPINAINNSTFSAAGATKLSDVTLGNASSDNTAWQAVTGLVIPSVVLKTLSIRNLVNFSSALNLSANVELETLDTRGTNAGVITLPSYAPLTTITLNACSGITALNLNNVETFSMASGNNLISAITLITLIVTPARTRVIRWVKGVNKTESTVDALQRIEERLDKIEDSLGRIANGTQASLRNGILQIADECLEKGYITSIEKQNLMDMYKAYSDLDGDQYATDRYLFAIGLPEKN